MVQRVVLGDIGGGQYGMKVSKPGINVLSASDTQLFLSTGFKAMQITQSGVISDPGSVGASRTFYYSSIGVKPFLWIHSAGWVFEVATGNLGLSSCTLTTTSDARTTYGGAPNVSGNIYWAVLARTYPV